ncbi:hypothetical protein SESBI_26308 [Sesbania bispinosa]|nr:hypothetical protein SESBI_26308 [Sesbania bispinosa]
MMHSIKGGWRQTFALAKNNESEGRKTRIRRSKEERKAMVESFIKKFQESNNGNFPSLNLTHKEVGGSFYTVREIVRDIIQENRVLGPAKFTLEELSTDEFLEQNPLGSIARDPQPFMVACSNENHPEPNKVNDTNGKMLSVSDGHYSEAKSQGVDKGHVINVGHVDVTNKEPIEATVVSDGYHAGAEHPMVDKGHVVNGSQVDVTNSKSVEATVVTDGHHTGAEHRIVDNGHVINGSQVDMINNESNEATIPEMQVGASQQNVEQELAATTTPVAKLTVVTEDLTVETFPLRSDARTTDGIESLDELRDSSNLPEKDIKTLELEQGNEKSELNGNEPTKNSNLLDEKISNAGHDKKQNLGDTLAESANHFTREEHSSHELEDRTTDPQVRVSHQNTKTFETINQSQIKDEAKTSIQDGFQTKNLSETYTEESKPSEKGPT